MAFLRSTRILGLGGGGIRGYELREKTVKRLKRHKILKHSKNSKDQKDSKDKKDLKEKINFRHRKFNGLV